jgi:hypothetical protein
LATHVDGEYRVAYHGRNAEAAAYYTTCSADALATAKAMVARCRLCAEGERHLACDR